MPPRVKAQNVAVVHANAPQEVDHVGTDGDVEQLKYKGKKTDGKSASPAQRYEISKLRAPAAR
jgi:hypothetical protein